MEFEIEKQAEGLGFVIRANKLSCWKFLDMLLFMHFNDAKLRLNKPAIQLRQSFGIEISKQAIDERFTQTAVGFIKEIPGQAIQIVINADEFKNLGLFPEFTRLKLKALTSF